MFDKSAISICDISPLQVKDEFMSAQSIEHISIAKPGPHFRSVSIVLSMVAFLASCQSGVGNFGASNFGASEAGQTQVEEFAQPLPLKNGPAEGEVLGFGPARVALLVPQTAPGNGAAVAKQLRNAAELAISDLGSDVMELVIKDTGGTPNGAISAAQDAMTEGATMVLGPVFSSSVTSARSIIARTQRPLVGFSSDPTAAGPGGYLISFLPDQIVSRSVEYAISQGRRNFVAILPSGAYGILVERQLQTSVRENNGSLLAITKYEYNSDSLKAAIEGLIESAKFADVIFIPDGGGSPLAILRMLSENDVDLTQKLILGTGQWRTSELKAPELQGGIFADMDQSRFNIFKQRYLQKYDSEPTVNAALGYDAVLLVGGLLKEKPGLQITRGEIEREQGFIGASGVFRFLSSGLNERGLAMFQIQDGEVVTIQAAPSSFNQNRFSSF